MAGIDGTMRRTICWVAAAAGLALLLVGLTVRNVVDSITWSSPAFAWPVIFGMALMLFGLIANRREIKDWLRNRRVRAFLAVWSGVTLAFLLLVLVNAISAKMPQAAGWSLDLTASRVNTLSPQTLSILDGLERDVAVTVFLGTGTVGGRPLGPDVEELARQYGARSGRVRTEIIDIYRNNVRARQAAMELDMEPPADAVVVSSGARKAQVAFADLAPSTGGPLPGAERIFVGEEKITSAILSVSEDERPVVYMVTGHCEMGPSGSETEALGGFAKELERNNYRVETLDISVEKQVPADAAVVVIAGPKGPFSDEETAALRAWLNGGGRLLLMALPAAARGNLAGLGTLLEEFNAVVDADEVAVEVYREVATGQEIGNLEVILRRYGEHPITRGMAAVNAVIRDASPIREARPESVAVPGRPMPVRTTPYKVTPLLMTTERSWGETDLAASPVKFDAGTDSAGPMNLAVAVERREAQSNVAAENAGPRLVVVGSTTMAFDGYMDRYMGNRTFLMNAVNWLAEREERLGIPPRRGERRELAASPTALKTIFFIAVVAMPLAALACGGAVWWLRRR